jgi:hypothetical protein
VTGLQEVITWLGLLPWKTIGEVITTIGGVGLLIFAAVQVYLQNSDSRDQKRTAYAALYAEYWRLNALSLDWEGEDLVKAARAGALYPDMLAPRDWGTIIGILGQISSATGALGGFAYALVNNATTAARHLVALANSPTAATTQMRDQESACKEALKEAVVTLEDALRAAPSWLGKHEFTLVDPRSKGGQAVEKYLLDLDGRLSPKRHEPRFWFLGKFLGRWLARAGRWLNPAA